MTIALKGIVTALPHNVRENADLADMFGAEAVAKIINATGIERRPVSASHTVSDLAHVAAEHLMTGLGWARESVGLLMVVTQTPDHPLPSTAAILQERLGLSVIPAMDINLGCSGYVYGLWQTWALMQSAGIQRALLVTGDMTTRLIRESNRALAPLFGDAVSVTALELDGTSSIKFDMGTDGAGAPYLISQTGGLRAPGEPELFMDGTQVMAFSLRQVAPSITRVLEASDRNISDMDRIVLHQANTMMLKTLGAKIKARDDQMVYAVRDYGNTSSASIPLALCDDLKNNRRERLKLLLCGFGVGWSWGSAVWETPAPQFVDIVRVP